MLIGIGLVPSRFSLGSCERSEVSGFFIFSSPVEPCSARLFLFVLFVSQFKKYFEQNNDDDKPNNIKDPRGNEQSHKKSTERGNKSN